MSTANDLYRELMELPEQERLRLVERVIHDLVDSARQRAAAAPPGEGSVIGLWSDEPDVVDELVEGVLHGRETRRLRATGDAIRDG